MLKIKHWQLNWLLAGMTLAVMGVSIAPTSAQRSPGSPIPTPIPVEPATGLMPQRTNYPDYSYPQLRQNVRNSPPINPVIRDSSRVNPVIINNSWHRTPFSGGRSRVFITYPQ
ncbi:MAG: hypothetical protein V7K50_25925 [Nostoc sp.]|uniref:hypothetical protein n=1 Tax=Nostoc sp. TaxID=1180 RepID=UPI002FFB5920